MNLARSLSGLSLSLSLVVPFHLSRVFSCSRLLCCACVHVCFCPLRLQLWEAVSFFNNKHKLWTTSPFLTIDCEELNKDVTTLLKTAFVLDKKVCMPVRTRAVVPASRCLPLSVTVPPPCVCITCG